MNRRTFLRRNGCAALGYVGMMNTIAQLRMLHNASAAVAPCTDDYKALVCVFFYGGNDSNNLVVPTGADYSAYADHRRILAVDENDLLGLGFTDARGRSFGMHPNLADKSDPGLPSVHDLFETGKLAVVANVGTLVRPVTQQEYFDKTVPLPPQLFSHSDQQVHWQSSVPDQPFSTGWGGRLADEMYMDNVGSQTSMSVSLAGHSDFMVGRELASAQLQLTAAGPLRIQNYGTPATGYRYETFDQVMNVAVDNLFAKEYQSRVAKARANNEFIREQIDTNLVLPGDFPTFPTNSLAGQLNMVAQMIALRASLNQKRQIFFVGIGGFDTHANQNDDQPDLMNGISTALGTFYRATEALGVADCVTTFTASDFNRTFTPNGIDDSAGSDHGWGGHALVMGGAVQGKQILGMMPDTLGSLDDTELNSATRTSRGRWIPTLSVDVYAATLAKWFGLGPEQLAEVFPNLHRFPEPDLGFMV